MILGELGLKEHWGRTLSPKTNAWKKVVRKAVTEWEVQKQKIWRNRKEMSAQWGMAMVGSDQTSPLLTLRGSDRALLAGVRLMITREELGIDEREGRECCLCKAENQQGIMHLVACCEKFSVIRQLALRKDGWNMSNRQKWWALTTGGERNMVFLREIARRYQKDTENSLIPWVGSLGSRQKEGLVGMSVLVQQVAKWVEKGHDS
jgi:hypothetical protein